MTSNVGSDTLQVTIKESVNLGGQQQGGETRFSVQSINEVSKRIVTVTTTSATFLTLGSAAGASAFINTDMRYLRVTNLDKTNFITLGFQDTSGDTAYFKLEAGQSFILHNDDIEAFTDGSAFSAFSQWDTMTMDADTASCDAEIFYASA